MGRWLRWRIDGYRIRRMTAWRHSTMTFRARTSQKQTSMVRARSSDLQELFVEEKGSGPGQVTQNLRTCSGQTSCNAGSMRRGHPLRSCPYILGTSCQVRFHFCARLGTARNDMSQSAITRNRGKRQALHVPDPWKNGQLGILALLHLSARRRIYTRVGGSLTQSRRRPRQLQREVSSSIWRHRGSERGCKERGLGQGTVGNN